MPGTVTSKWTLDTAEFDAPLKRTVDLTTASGRAIEMSAQKAAQAQALAAKLGGDAVSEQTLRIVAARNKEAAASTDFRKAQALNKAGYDSEVGGANLAAAALQRLTAAKLEVANASKVEEAQGLASTMEMARSTIEVLALAEGFNKLREAVSSALEFGETIQRASEKTGLSVETLSTLHYAAAITGGDFDKMTTAVAKMDKTIAQATEGNKTAQAFMKALGLNAGELAGRSDGAEIAFRKFATTLAATENPIRRVELATGLLGRAGAEQIPTLIQLGAHLEEFRQGASDTGTLLNGQTLAALVATRQKFQDIQQALMGSTVAFTEGFTPSIVHMISVISGGKTPMEAMKTFGNDLARIFAGVASAVYGAASGMDTFIALYEGGSLTKAGQADLDRAKELNRQAMQFRDIALTPNGTEVAPKSSYEAPAGATPKGGFDKGVGDLGGAENKAAQERLRAMEVELNQEKQQSSVSIKAEYDYWQARIGAFKAGSSEYATVVAKSAELAVAGARQAAEAIRKFRQSQLKGTDSNATGDEIVGRYNEERQKDAVKALGDSSQDQLDSNKLAVDKAHNDAREREAQLTEEAGRSMSRYAAAIEIASVHAQEFRQVMEALQADLDVKQYQQGLAPTRQGAKGVTDAQTAIANANSQRTIQMQQDQIASGGAQDTSMLTGAKDALNDFVAASRDAAAMMRNLVDKTLNGLNDQLVRAMSGQKTSFGNFGAGVARDVAGSALKKGEGDILSLFGLGGGTKPTGAKGNPFHVMVDNPQPAPGQPPGPDGLPSPTPSPGGIQGLISTGLSFLPGFADGGAIAPNTWAMVGERGPEPFFSGSGGGTIVPNGKALPSGGGGGGDIHFHPGAIDARGSTDPAAVEAAAHRAVMAAAPGIAAAAVKAGREQQMRSPQSKR